MDRKKYVFHQLVEFIDSDRQVELCYDEHGNVTIHIENVSAEALKSMTAEPEQNKALFSHFPDAKETLQSLFNEVKSVISVKDIDGRYVLANDYFAKVIGRSLEDILGHNDFDIFDQSLALRLSEIDQRIIATGEESTYEDYYPYTDGVNYPYLINKVPLRNCHGVIYGVAVIATNISVQKEKERTLGLLRTEQQKLLSSLQEKYNELEEEAQKRREAEAKLEALAHSLQGENEAKSRFLANMSHEIRTPITSIIGYAEAIEEGDADNSSIGTIIRNGKHLLSVINDILDLSKIEACKLDVEIINIDFFRLLKDVESVVSKMAKDKGLEFLFEYQIPLPNRILSDATRLRQILINLCNNAIKFTDRGYIQIWVSNDAKRKRLYFSVVDTGIGMSKGQQDKLFEPFSQADTSTSRIYGGSGLGLNISRSLAHLMGGDITFTSEEQLGSCFTLEVEMNLPDNCKFVSDVPLESCHNEGQTLTSAQLSGNVLLAEDHEDNRQLIVMMLTKLGLTVVEARNGEEAVQLAMAQDFDLILLDIQMPVMDGLQAREMLSQIGVDAPIIALTANAMKHEVENYMTVGFDDYLAKPIKRAHFIETIAAYLNQADEVTKDKPEGTFINDEFDILKNNYIDTLRYEVEQLLVYAEDRNYAQISCISHAIKGTAGNFGLSPATELAGHIESLAREAKLDHDLLKKLFTYALEQVDLAKNTVD